MRVAAACALLGVAVSASAHGDSTLPIESFRLDNGMTFLMLPRPEMPSVEAGWVVGVGSASESRGSTGSSHLIEHMLFKGTETLGSRDIVRELKALTRLDELDAELATLSAAQGRKATRRRNQILADREQLTETARSLTQLGAVSLEYSRVGASRLNANTARDFTLYYVTLPAEKLELWFWIEADRLLHPVFREFESEKGVVAEERRLRIESTPTGAAEEALDSAFWRGSPYAHPTLGLPEDVAASRRSDLISFFESHYQPERITAVLVGNFDPDRVRALAEAYFGRLPNGARPTELQPIELGRQEEEDFTQGCQCPSQVRIIYPTVPFADPDQFALQALAGVLNGRGGRLYRRLVLGKELAFAAWAQQTPLARAGAFTVTLEAKGGTASQRLVEAWDLELEKLLLEPVESRELSRVQRRLATEGLNQLKDPHILMRRLLVYAGLGDWRLISNWAAGIAGVEPADIERVAREYLRRDRRLVGHFERGAQR